MRVRGRLWATALVLGTTLAAAGSAAAQGRGGGGGMGHGGGGMGPVPREAAPPFGREPSGAAPMASAPAAGPRAEAGGSATRAGLQLGPVGRWWDDKSLAKSLKLRPDQKSRMDAIFEQNRPALLARYQSLQQAEFQMLEAARSPNPDEAALFAGIDRVAQARAELDKANTHMLLQLRKQMDPDQIERLEKQK